MCYDDNARDVLAAAHASATYRNKKFKTKTSLPVKTHWKVS